MPGMKGRLPVCARTWKLGDSSTMRCSLKAKGACGRCEPIRAGKPLVPSPVPASRNATRPFCDCASSTASPSMHCTQRRQGCGKVKGTCGEARLRAAHERLLQRAKEGQALPRSMGISRAGARLPESPSQATQEPVFLALSRKARSVEAPLGTPVALARGALRITSGTRLI
jgi:hypothetical protein